MAAWRSRCKTSSRKRLLLRRSYSTGKVFHVTPHTHPEAVSEHDDHDARVMQELAEMQASIFQVLDPTSPCSLLSFVVVVLVVGCCHTLYSACFVYCMYVCMYVCMCVYAYIIYVWFLYMYIPGEPLAAELSVVLEINCFGEKCLK